MKAPRRKSSQSAHDLSRLWFNLRLDDLVQDLPRTRPLYLEDAYVTSFNATVLRAELEGKRNVYLVLDATAFHPKSGGQPSDTGILEGSDSRISVKKSMILNGVIVHFGAAEGHPGAQVLGTIEWKPRYLLMRRHTGGHLLDHCLERATGTNVETTDSWLGEGCYVAYRGVAPSEEVVVRAVKIENELIPRGGTVSVEEVGWEELRHRAPHAPNLQRLPSLEKYRIVTIEGLTSIPCAGTHLHNIKEIGEIRLKGIEQLEHDFRIYYDVVDSLTT